MLILDLGLFSCAIFSISLWASKLHQRNAALLLLYCIQLANPI
jgi:hypothetical protein